MNQQQRPSSKSIQDLLPTTSLSSSTTSQLQKPTARPDDQRPKVLLFHPKSPRPPQASLPTPTVSHDTLSPPSLPASAALPAPSVSSHDHDQEDLEFEGSEYSFEYDEDEDDETCSIPLTLMSVSGSEDQEGGMEGSFVSVEEGDVRRGLRRRMSLKSERSGGGGIGSASAAHSARSSRPRLAKVLKTQSSNLSSLPTPDLGSQHPNSNPNPNTATSPSWSEISIRSISPISIANSNPSSLSIISNPNSVDPSPSLTQSQIRDLSSIFAPTVGSVNNRRKEQRPPLSPGQPLQQPQSQSHSSHPSHPPTLLNLILNSLPSTLHILESETLAPYNEGRFLSPPSQPQSQSQTPPSFKKKQKHGLERIGEVCGHEIEGGRSSWRRWLEGEGEAMVEEEPEGMRTPVAVASPSLSSTVNSHHYHHHHHHHHHHRQSLSLTSLILSPLSLLPSTVLSNLSPSWMEHDFGASEKVEEREERGRARVHGKGWGWRLGVGRGWWADE